MIWNRETERCSVKKKVAHIAVTVMAAISLFGGAYADESDGLDSGTDFESDKYWEYEGELDPYTDKPKGGYTPAGEDSQGEDPDSQPAQANEVNLSGTSYYDRELDRFVYPTSAGKVFVSVVDGMVVTGEVYVSISENMQIYLYCNGEKVEETTEYVVSEPGEYVVATSGLDIDSRVMKFTIVGEVTGALYRYDMPESFYIRNVYFNNEQVEDAERTFALLAEEGEYLVAYTCSVIGKEYSLAIKVDHTAPQLTFKGANEKLVARGPVTIEGLGPGEYLSVTRNGGEYKLDPSLEIVERGTYEVYAYDDAGNSQTYNLKILTYINFNGMIFIIVFLLVAGGIAAYLLIHRKKLRIR